MASRFMQSFQEAGKQVSSSSAAIVELRDELPNVAEVLAGTKNEMGGWEVPPMTLMLFVEGDRLKFCLSAQQHGRVAFGCVQDPAKGLQSVEEALVKGAYEWKAKKGQGRY